MNRDVSAADSTAFREQVFDAELAPFWEVVDRNRSPQPVTISHHWKWSLVEPLLWQAGDLVSTEEAERRVLMLVNPATRGEKRAVGNLYAGIQLVLPGEQVRAHRHTAAALRFILQGDGATTIVDGDQISLQRFDLVVTPTWCWHDHANGASEPVVWLDALDSPFTRALDAWFFEPYPERHQRPIASSRTESQDGEHALLYPWERARTSMWAAVASSHQGSAAVAYIDPKTGRDVLPTTRCRAIGVAASGRFGPVRRVGGGIYCVVEGTGTARVGPDTYDLSFGDVFCVPSWCELEITSGPHQSLSLFSYDDEPVLKAFGLHREDEGESG